MLYQPGRYLSSNEEAILGFSVTERHATITDMIVHLKNFTFDYYNYTNVREFLQNPGDH